VCVLRARINETPLIVVLEPSLIVDGLALIAKSCGATLLTVTVVLAVAAPSPDGENS